MMRSIGVTVTTRREFSANDTPPQRPNLDAPNLDLKNGIARKNVAQVFRPESFPASKP
jgi:hypothetical protein